MTSQKAIEILSDSAYKGVTTFNQDFKDALKMSIYSLIRHRDRVHKSMFQMMEPLPFEET